MNCLSVGQMQPPMTCYLGLFGWPPATDNSPTFHLASKHSVYVQQVSTQCFTALLHKPICHVTPPHKPHFFHRHFRIVRITSKAYGPFTRQGNLLEFQKTSLNFPLTPWGDLHNLDRASTHFSMLHIPRTPLPKPTQSILPQHFQPKIGSTRVRGLRLTGNPKENGWVSHLQKVPKLFNHHYGPNPKGSTPKRNSGCEESRILQIYFLLGYHVNPLPVKTSIYHEKTGFSPSTLQKGGYLDGFVLTHAHPARPCVPQPR